MLNKILSFFKSNTNENNIVGYEKHVIGNNGNHSKENKQKISKIKKQLHRANIITSKIRFVFTPNFTYDINNDIINPKHDILIPISETGDYFIHSGVIYNNKPKNCILVFVKSYTYSDIFDFLRKLTKKTKKGIVIYVNKDTIINNNTIRLSILDELTINKLNHDEQN